MLRKEQIEYALHYAEDPVEWVFELVRGLEKRIDELLKFGTKVTVFQEHWHPASELPILKDGEDDVDFIVICDGYGISLPFHATYCKYTGWSHDNVKWWSYPPEEEEQ